MEKGNVITWIEQLSVDTELWMDDISKFPSIIAFEYKNLRDQCRKNQIYGALMCLKDNFESLLKLELLLSFAWAFQNTDETFHRQVLSEITTPNLSLGAWMHLSNVFLKNLNNTGKQLPAELVLEQIWKAYNSYEIVNWRNQKIGHGAMELDDDENFRASLINKLKELRDILNQISDGLNNQKLYAGELCLEGPEAARYLNTDESVSCLLIKSNVRFTADPYLVIHHHESKGNGLYFFDNQKTRAISYFQSYIDGSQFRVTSPHFEMMRRYLEERGLNQTIEPDNPYLNEAENRELELLQMSHGFVRMEPVIQWLKDILKQNTKGLFLLQMERGMGKSVLAGKLDMLYKDPLILDDQIDVRTYQFSRAQKTGSEDFSSRIEWQWANQYGNSRSWQRVPRISDLVREGLSPAEALCKFLQEVRRYSEWSRGKSRILMILDGIDEIIQDDLWNMLPEPGMLPEGIYILLTSRCPDVESMLPELGDRINNLSVDYRYSIKRTNIINEKFLRTYIKNAELNSLKETEIQILIEKADYRVLYLGVLCKLLGAGLSIHNLPDTSIIIRTYLDVLKQHYGEHETESVLSLLSVIATLGDLEPLTLQTIGTLTKEGKLTLGLIGMMRDLSPLLKVIRDLRGNRYTMANPDIANELRNQIPDIQNYIHSIMQLCLDQIYAGYPLEIPELEPAIAHIVELLQLTDKTEGLSLLGEDFLDKMDAFRESAWKHLQFSNRGQRIIQYSFQLVLFCKATFGDQHEKTMHYLDSLGSVYLDHGYYTEALHCHQEAHNIASIIFDSKHIDTVTITHHIATDYFYLGNYHKAKPLAESVVEFRSKTLNKEHEETLESMNLLALIYSGLGDYQNALTIHQQILEQRTKILGLKHSATIASMNNIAIIYKAQNRYEEAATQCEEALSLSKEVLGEENPDTIQIMTNLASIYDSMGHQEEGFALCQQSLSLNIKILGKENPASINNLNNLGSCYLHMGKQKDALTTHLEALELAEKALGEHHPITITIMINLDRDYASLERYEDAIEISIKGLELCSETYGIYHEHTFLCLKNLATDYSETNQHEAAIDIGVQAIDTWNHITKNEEYDQDIVFLMNSLSFNYGALGKMKEAADMCLKAYQLSRDTYGETNQTTISLMQNLAVIYKRLGKNQEALFIMNKLSRLSGKAIKKKRKRR